jgi:ATP-dependent helicase/nuclease subunit B
MKPCRELISAPAGTGKTRTCIEIFRRSILERPDPFSQKSFFILPNQEHAARINDLLLRSDGGAPRPEGILSPAVLTINQFIQRFAGIGAERTPGDMLKHYFLNEILREGGWKYFDPDFSCGLVPLLGDFLREAKAGFLSASDFEERARPFIRGDARGDKFADLIRIFRAYEERLEAAGLEDTGDLIRRFVRTIPSRAVPALDLVILDGFYHFTRAQIEFVKTVTRIARRTIVTLTRDPARSALFEFPERTRAELIDAGFSEAAWAEGTNRRALQPALAALEKNLFLETPEVYAGPAGAVTVFEAAAASGEIEMIAREIKRLYRGTGYHYSDFCLVFRSIGPYEGLIESIFRDFEIPVEIHERKRLKANALVRAFDRWLGLLAEGWKREDFLALLSSHYYGCPDEAVRKLAAVSFERGWLGGREEIARLVADLAGPEKEWVEKFTGWHAKMAAEKDPSGVMRVLRKFLEDQGFHRRRAETDEAAREDHQAYRTLLKLLDEIGRQPLFAGGEGFDFSGCVRRLREAIDLSLFSLPSPDKNRVQVYDIAFALQKEYRVVFAAGLLEKSFPQRAIEDPVLKDDERRLLNGRNPCLEERLGRAGGERYFFYMAVSRARERLYLTYPRFDLEAKETLPSFYAEEVKKCFAGPSLVIRSKQVGDVVPEAAEISRPGDLFQILNLNLFAPRPAAKPEDGGFLKALYNACIRRKDYRAVLEAVKREPEAAEFRDPEILARFRGLAGPFSPTRLELFATCPFKYFAAKTLKLQEERDSMDPTVLGSLLHKVLEEFYAETAGGGKDEWVLLKDPEAAKEQLRAKLEDVLSRPEFRFGGAKKFRQDLERARLAEMLEGFVEAEHDTETGRATHPRYFEQAFGMGDEGLPALEIGGEEPVALQGKIDRIDWDAKTGLAVVVDYKRGAAKTDRLLEGLEKGVALQLPIYLLAAQKLLGAQAAAAELYPLLDPARRGGIYHRERMARVGAYRERYQGAMNGEEFEALLKKIGEAIPAYVARLRGGDISIRSKGCDHCPYGHLCRFEKWKLIYSEEEKLWTKKK